jgi:hypothetical protein
MEDDRQSLMSRRTSFMQQYLPSDIPTVFHEVATLFPPMGEEEFTRFVADIQQRGLLEPIWTFQGKIVDGVHRYRACQQLGIEPRYQEWDGHGSLVHFVVSRNLQRRHLTAGQRAMLALEVERQFAKEAEKRMHAGKAPDPGTLLAQGVGKAAHQAAAAMRTSGTYVKEAKRIAAHAPELTKMVIGGTLTLPDAKQLAHLSEPQRQEVVRMMATGQAKKAKTAVLHLKKAAIEAQAQAAPSKPRLSLASWEDWLLAQPPCDLLLTDPPYSTEVEDIESFAQTWLPLALSKVRSTGRAYVCIGAYPRELRAYLNVRACWEVAQVLVWSYRNTLGPKPAMGYKQNWQAILSFCGPDAPPLDCPLLTEQFSTQEINAPDGRQGGHYHAWQKPDALAERLIRHATRPGDVVYDIFSGTGTFLLAAQRLGRVGRGCDRSEEMLAIAEKRGCAIAR